MGFQSDVFIPLNEFLLLLKHEFSMQTLYHDLTFLWFYFFGKSGIWKLNFPKLTLLPWMGVNKPFSFIYSVSLNSSLNNLCLLFVSYVSGSKIGSKGIHILHIWLLTCRKVVLVSDYSFPKDSTVLISNICSSFCLIKCFALIIACYSVWRNTEDSGLRL